MLERLFTSKNRVKLLEYFLFKKKDTYIREIVKELKISPSAVKREVDNLVKVGIIKKEKNKISLETELSFLEDLKNIFIKTDFILYPLREVLLTDKKISFSFVFGSFARAEYVETSDVDLMILGDIDSFELYKKIKPVEDKLKRDIKPVVWTIKNLKEQKKSSFVRDIFKKGIIMVKGDENELRKIIK